MKCETIEFATENSVPGNTISLDYVGSDNAAEIDRGIRDSIKGIRFSILAMGLGLAKIKERHLYKDLGCRSMTKYIQMLCHDTKMDQSSIYNWLYVGEAYLKYRSDLEQVGFSDDDGPTKLPYLERALAVREKDEVFDNIKNMSVSEFIDFSKGEPDKTHPDMPYVIIKGNIVYINGTRAIILNRNLGRRTSAYFFRVIEVACEALEKGGLIVPIFVKTKKDARRFEWAAERLKAKMRMN